MFIYSGTFDSSTVGSVGFVAGAIGYPRMPPRGPPKPLNPPSGLLSIYMKLEFDICEKPDIVLKAVVYGPRFFFLLFSASWFKAYVVGA